MIGVKDMWVTGNQFVRDGSADILDIKNAFFGFHLRQQHDLKKEVTQLSGRVLLVEDNDVNRLVACRMLEHLGLEVATAGDGATALAMCAEQHFDCLLMDVQMPVMDGLEATRALRRREREAGRDPVPIIAHGVWRGRVLTEPRGDHGFGYDPLFWVESENASAAEMSAEHKNRVSHRARAMHELIERLRAGG